MKDQSNMKYTHDARRLEATHPLLSYGVDIRSRIEGDSRAIIMFLGRTSIKTTIPLEHTERVDDPKYPAFEGQFIRLTKALVAAVIHKQEPKDEADFEDFLKQCFQILVLPEPLRFLSPPPPPEAGK